MDYSFYNTDARAMVEQPRPRFRVLMYENGIGVVAIGQVRDKWDGVSYEQPLYYTATELSDLTGRAFEQLQELKPYAIDVYADGKVRFHFGE